MEKWTIEEVLRRALTIEAENYGEYTREAQHATIPAVKAMFTFLAKEEEMHMQLIRDKMAQFGVKE